MSLLDVERAYSLALARLKKAAEPEEVERELAHLREAAEVGYAPAQYAYADWLDIIKADTLGGIPFLVQAAQQGHADSRHELYRRYVGQKSVRAFVRERLTTEQIDALGLTEGNFFTRLFIPNETGNTPFGLLVGLLFIGGVSIFLVTCLAAWHEAWLGVAPTDTEAIEAALIMLSIYFGAFLFCLCGLVAMLLEWRKAGSGAYHPLAFIFMVLFIGYLTAVLLGWGWYEFSSAPRGEEQWWLPSLLCTLAGLLTGGFLLKTLAGFNRVSWR